MKHLEGYQTGNLTVLYKAASNRAGKVNWLCKCKCGIEKVYLTDHLVRKNKPVKSCGCLRYKSGPTHKQWNGFKGISGGWWAAHVLRERTQKYRIKVPVLLTKEQAWELYEKQMRRCALTGLPIEISSGAQTNSASLDRIDSSKGYEIGNIQWVHKHVNFMKRTYSQEYFVKMCSLVSAHMQSSV
jgi:hypothetical protein